MRPKVLLVDDIDFFLAMEKDCLSKANVEILTAKNGQQALEVALREKPHLIFMDVNMPVMDGLSCCRILKNHQQLRKIPVIMVFAGSRDITPETCRQAGCDGVLSKPLDRDKFLDLGRKFLQEIERRDPRTPCRAQVTIRRYGREIAAESEDISESGMYIISTEEVVCDESIRVFARFPGGSASGEIMAKVMWVNQGEQRINTSMPEGFGVKFSNLSPTAQMTIRQILRKLAGSMARLAI